jgi:hypothetical protein
MDDVAAAPPAVSADTALADAYAVAGEVREGGFTDIEVARAVCQVLRLAAERLGLAADSEHDALRDLCGRLVAASRNTGRLSPFEYRLC